MNLLEAVVLYVVIASAMWKVCEWAWNYVARRKERSRAAITDREHRNSLARAIREDRRELSARIARDMAQRGYTPAPFHFPADAHAPEKLDRESGYGTSTRLSVVPKA